MKTFAIVDAYSSANLLAPLFHKEGVRTIHVQSTHQIPFVYHNSFKRDDFASNIVHQGDVTKTVDLLKKEGVVQVIVGIESGVELADQLSESMGCFSNGTALSEARRHKFRMIEALQDKGMQCIPSLLTNNIDKAISWVGENYPVVCKPPKSAGTDNVIICSNHHDVRSAFGEILGKMNRLLLLNEEVFVQKFVTGREFCVDTVSSDGAVFPVSIHEAKKILHCGSRLYDREQFLPFEGKIPKQLFEYACEVVSALGIRFGPAHLEIMLTDSGPVLIEIGARLIGSGFPVLQQVCLGQNHADLTVESYLNKDKFRSRLNSRYQLKSQLLRVCLISDVVGIFEEFRYLNKLQQLPGFHQFTPKIKPGQFLRRSNNLFNIPGFVDFIHADTGLLETNYQQVRKWERQGMYKVR